MNTFSHVDDFTRQRGKASSLGLGIAALVFAGVLASSGSAAAADATATVTSAIDQAATTLRAEYRQQQWNRLAAKPDRDSLIAAVLLGMPNEIDHEPIDGQADVERRLAKQFGRDPDAMFSLALACQMSNGTCVHSEYYSTLIQLAPDNAVHWLLLPNAGAPSAEQLHSAATTSLADTHLRLMIRVVREALANQPAPTASKDVDPRELGLRLRRNAVDLVPLPKFGAIVSLCKAPAETSRTDCIELGRRLFADRDGTILTRMVGSAMLRRLEKGTQEEMTAKQSRREYVWLSEQLAASSSDDKERLQREVAEVGEWSASQQAVERLGVSSTPPAAWVPKNPQTLLLSEERTASPKK